MVSVVSVLCLARLPSLTQLSTYTALFTSERLHKVRCIDSLVACVALYLLILYTRNTVLHGVHGTFFAYTFTSTRGAAPPPTGTAHRHRHRGQGAGRWAPPCPWPGAGSRVTSSVSGRGERGGEKSRAKIQTHTLTHTPFATVRLTKTKKQNPKK